MRYRRPALLTPMAMDLKLAFLVTLRQNPDDSHTRRTNLPIVTAPCSNLYSFHRMYLSWSIRRTLLISTISVFFIFLFSFAHTLFLDSSTSVLYDLPLHISPQSHFTRHLFAYSLGQASTQILLPLTSAWGRIRTLMSSPDRLPHPAFVYSLLSCLGPVS